jgi:hypothetical protein
MRQGRAVTCDSGISRLTIRIIIPAVTVVALNFRPWADGATALAVVVALLVVLLASTGLLAVGGEVSGAFCFNCSSCESGECGDDGCAPSSPDHHCCNTSCFSLTPVVFSRQHVTPTPVTSGRLHGNDFVAAASLPPDTPYRPPRG